MSNNKMSNLTKVLRELGFATVKEALIWCHDNGYDIRDKQIRNIIAHNLCVQFDSVKRISNRMLKELNNINKNVVLFSNKTTKEVVTKFSVDKNGYVIHAQKGSFHLTIETVDNLFYDFSIHGLDLTSTQVINKYNLEPWQWYALKNALNLYKVSNIFSPYTLQNLSDEEKEKLIEGKIKNALNNKINIENVYNQTVIKEYKKVITENNKRQLLTQGLGIGLQEIKDTFKYKTVLNSISPTAYNRPINVFIADLHAGAEVKDLFITPDFDLKILEKKLNNIALEINKLNSKEVYITFLGDIIESFTGHNHKNTWQELEKGMFGAKLIKEVILLILQFLSNINNVAKIYAIGGNHDRGDSNNLIDYKGEIAGIIFSWLETLLPYPVEFNFTMVNPEIDNIKYICMHGHHKEINCPAEQTILNYGEQKKYNLLVSGHLHTFKIKDDKNNFRQVVCPSVFTGNNYSERLGYSSNSGFMIAMNNGHDKINLFTYSI